MKQLFSPRPLAETLASQSPDLKTLAMDIACQVLHGAHGRKTSGTGEQFWQFREYQSGDALPAIDWRQSAKTDRLYIRQTEQQKAQSFYFWCKQDPDMDFCSATAPRSKHQTASILALTLAILHIQAGESVGYSTAVRASHSENTLQALESALENRTDPESLPPESLATLPRHAALYLFSDCLEPLEALASAITPLLSRTRNITLIQILDPAERTFPYKGRILFKNTGGTDMILTPNAESVQKDFQGRMRKHIESIDRFCKKENIAFLSCTTNEPLLHPILEIGRLASP